MFVFLLTFLAASELTFLAAPERRLYALPGVPQSPMTSQDVNDLDSDGRVWLAKAYGQNYENFNQIRGDSSAFMYDTQSQSYVPVVTHTTVREGTNGSYRPRSAWWSRVIFVAFGVLAFAKRVPVVPLMRYAFAV
jgi:hypothetical protein